jgi:hypothetical protein
LVVGHANLIVFFLRRFTQRRGPLPVVFMFIPASLVVSVAGHFLMVMGSLGVGPTSLVALGHDLAYYAFMLGIVLGVGSKIIPAFTGHGPVMNVSAKYIYGMMVLFFASFFVQSLGDLRWGLFLRLAAVAFVGLQIWRIQQRPPNPSKTSMGLWLSCWGVVLATLGAFLFPTMLLQWNHFLFIAGFGLMTLMIGSRVIFAHGGFDVMKEGEHPWMVAIIGVLLAAGCVRLFLYSSEALYRWILAGSSVLWLLSLGFWWLHVGRRTQGRKNAPIRSCP